ncbi:DUF799 domain-containing protein [Sphaerotilus natans]|uniref:DUF799 domain-containing protein n=2 Tax=Sphaerotilus natans TaxID=34103 RepID=UPI000563FC2F|nr:DUF799 domain-containing protein [Sphaerotilus natans]SIQ74240.1 hypothetical protein SAMN05421778_104211 [Sphaerotilus natans]
MMSRGLRILSLVSLVALSTGCATKAPPYDYSGFMKAKPTSLLVLPPINESPEVKGSSSVWAQTTKPLSEAGYYVLPAALVNETFRQNGVGSPAEAHNIPAEKLREFFGADAAVLIKIPKYGTSYYLITSETRVEIEAKIVDLRSGALLWEGKAQATSAENNQQSQGGLAGLLIAAVVQQVVGTAADVAFDYSGIATDRALGAPRYNGILPGPRSPKAWQVQP